MQELSARLAAEKISKGKETESKEMLARQAKQQVGNEDMRLIVFAMPHHARHTPCTHTPCTS
jgi:hypothetical protein